MTLITYIGGIAMSYFNNDIQSNSILASKIKLKVISKINILEIVTLNEEDINLIIDILLVNELCFI